MLITQIFDLRIAEFLDIAPCETGIQNTKHFRFVKCNKAGQVERCMQIYQDEVLDAYGGV